MHMIRIDILRTSGVAGNPSRVPRFRDKCADGYVHVRSLSHVFGIPIACRLLQPHPSSESGFEENLSRRTLLLRNRSYPGENKHCFAPGIPLCVAESSFDCD